MKRWRFETNRISSVATAQPQSQKPVFNFDLTWWPDLWWPGAEIFTQCSKFNCEQVLKKWWRCAPPFFRYPRKPEVLAFFAPPPSSPRVKPPIHKRCSPTGRFIIVGRCHNCTVVMELRSFIFNLRPAGGCLITPCGISRIARKRRRLAPPGFQLPYPHLFGNFCESFDPGSCKVRSPGQVKWPYLTKTLQSRPSYSVWGTVMKLSEYDMVISTYKTYISDFWYRWP